MVQNSQKGVRLGRDTINLKLIDTACKPILYTQCSISLDAKSYRKFSKQLNYFLSLYTFLNQNYKSKMDVLGFYPHSDPTQF